MLKIGDLATIELENGKRVAGKVVDLDSAFVYVRIGNKNYPSKNNPDRYSHAYNLITPRS